MTKIEELRAERSKKLNTLSKDQLIKKIMNATLFTETTILVYEELGSAPFSIESLLSTIKSTHSELDK